MPFGFLSRRHGVLLLTVAAILAVFVLLPGLATAQTPDLLVRVGDTTGPSGQQNSVITVYLNNYNDSIAGFSVWLRLDRPDIMRFQVDTQQVYDTTYWRCLNWNGPNCLDSIAIPKDSLDDYAPNSFMRIKDTAVTVGNINTVGSLIANWDLVRTRSISGQGTDILVTALHSTELQPPQNPPPQKPQTGGVLFRLLADILPIPDTATQRTVNISVEHDFLDKFIFSRPNGTAIGIYGVPTPDTVCWRCTNEVEPGVCSDSATYSLPPCDWTTIEIDTVPTLDTTKVIIIDGSLTVDVGCCVGTTGDANKNGTVNTLDLAFVIQYLTPPAGPTLICKEETDINANGTVNSLDLAFLIQYLTPPAGPALPNCP